MFAKPLPCVPEFFDVFPGELIDNLHHWRTLTTDKDLLIHDSIAFVSYIPKMSNKIRFQHVKKNLPEMAYCGKLFDSYSKSSYSGASDDWNCVQVKLKKPLNTAFQKKCDSRLGFRYKNTFLVKPGFTFGGRFIHSDPMADNDEVHLIQVGQAPIYFYVLPNGIHTTAERHFKGTEKHIYKRFVLQPNSLYRVIRGIEYVLLTAEPTLFAINRCTNICALLISKAYGMELKNPLQDTEWPNNRLRKRTSKFDAASIIEMCPPSVMPMEWPETEIDFSNREFETEILYAQDTTEHKRKLDSPQQSKRQRMDNPSSLPPLALQNQCLLFNDSVNQSDNDDLVLTNPMDTESEKPDSRNTCSEKWAESECLAPDYQYPNIIAPGTECSAMTVPDSECHNTTTEMYIPITETLTDDSNSSIDMIQNEENKMTGKDLQEKPPTKFLRNFIPEDEWIDVLNFIEQDLAKEKDVYSPEGFKGLNLMDDLDDLLNDGLIFV